MNVRAFLDLETGAVVVVTAPEELGDPQTWAGSLVFLTYKIAAIT